MLSVSLLVGLLLLVAARAWKGPKWVRAHVRATAGAAPDTSVEVTQSSVDITGHLSARLFLLSDAADANTREVLARKLSESGGHLSKIKCLRGLPAPALHAVNQEIATVVDGLLNLDLGKLLMSGWRKHTDLESAAKRTLADPTNEEIVVLGTHRSISTHHLSVDLIVNGVNTHTFVFELTVVFDLNGSAVVVRGGDLVALRGGECVVTATLTLEGTQLELSRKGRIDLAPDRQNMKRTANDQPAPDKRRHPQKADKDSPQ
jgi:hypothetical protein